MTDEPTAGNTFATAVDTFASAASAFSQLVDQIGPTDWEGPGLGVWNVRDLVGHTSRSLVTVESYLGKLSSGDLLNGPVAYFLAARASLADADAVAQRGRDAGAALGDDPPAAIHALIDRVTATVASSREGEPVGTPIGTMTLADYLPTRIFELSVHSLDIARALDLEAPVDLAAGIAASCRLVGELAAHSPDAPAFLLALTGRTGLAEGFSLL